MKLKLFTTFCLIVGVAMLACDAHLLARPPSRAEPLKVRKAFVEDLLASNVILLLSLCGSVTGAALVIRQAKDEYRQGMLREMGSLADNVKPASSGPMQTPEP